MAASRPWDAIGYRLINGTAVSALVGSTAIWHGEFPDPETGFPAINFFAVAGKQLLHKGQVTSDVYQVSCRATAASDVMNLARAVEIDWQNFQGPIDGAFNVAHAEVTVNGSFWEPEAEVYQAPVLIRLQYNSSEG